MISITSHAYWPFWYPLINYLINCLSTFPDTKTMICLSFSDWFVELVYIFWIQILWQIEIFTYLLPVCSLNFHSFDNFFGKFLKLVKHKNSNINETHRKGITCFPCMLDFGSYLRHLPTPKSWRISSMLSFRSSIILPFMLKSITHHKWIFVYGFPIAF